MTVWTIAAPASPLALLPGMILKLEAISPTTGAAITGVTVSNWAVYGDELDTHDDGTEAGTPSWVWGDEDGGSG